MRGEEAGDCGDAGIAAMRASCRRAVCVEPACAHGEFRATCMSAVGMAVRTAAPPCMRCDRRARRRGRIAAPVACALGRVETRCAGVSADPSGTGGSRRRAPLPQSNATMEQRGAHGERPARRCRALTGHRARGDHDRRRDDVEQRHARPAQGRIARASGARRSSPRRACAHPSQPSARVARDACRDRARRCARVRTSRISDARDRPAPALACLPSAQSTRPREAAARACPPRRSSGPRVAPARQATARSRRRTRAPPLSPATATGAATRRRTRKASSARERDTSSAATARIEGHARARERARCARGQRCARDASAVAARGAAAAVGRDRPALRRACASDRPGPCVAPAERTADVVDARERRAQRIAKTAHAAPCAACRHARAIGAERRAWRAAHRRDRTGKRAARGAQRSRRHRVNGVHAATRARPTCGSGAACVSRRARVRTG